MNKYAFNHEAEQMPEGLGIQEDRFDQLNEAARDAVLRALVYDDAINNTLKMFECAINKALPKGEVEAMMFGYMLGKTHAKISELNKRLASVMGQEE